MRIENSPVCTRHDGDIPMHLRTMHSEQALPDQVTGLFECPQCGFERRLPIDITRQG